MSSITNLVGFPRKAIKGIHRGFFHVFGHSDYKRFIILSRSRTGSNLLNSFLNSHPNIHTEGEVASKLNGRKPKDILARSFGKEPYCIKAKGFKIFYYHPMDDDSKDIWHDLLNMDDLRVVHLKRRNIFRTLISRKIAVLQDVWATDSPARTGDGGKKGVGFTVEELENSFEQTREWENRGDEMFNSHPLVSVCYEDLVSDPESTYRKVTDFLGLQYVHPTTHLKKQNTEKLADLVINYDDLKSAFHETQWEVFFEE